jgi:hypothetical protein
VSESTNSILGVSTGPTELAAELSRKFPSLKAIRTVEPNELKDLDEGVYDGAIWIEASPTKDRRNALVHLARQVRTGGCAVFADGLRSAVGAGDNIAYGSAFVDSSERYASDLKSAGFVCSQILDATTETWIPFFNHSRNFYLAKLLLNQIDSAKQASIFSRLPAGDLGLKQYILVSASKLGTTDDN